MNLIPEICKLLGVEIGEKFYIRRTKDNARLCAVFKFTESELLHKENGKEKYEWSYAYCTSRFGTLDSLINGIYEVEKMPFEPEYQEQYFWVSLNKSNFVHDVVMDDYWCGNTNDYQRKYCGNCFRTKAEALKHKHEVYKRLTGRKWEES